MHPRPLFSTHGNGEIRRGQRPHLSIPELGFKDASREPDRVLAHLIVPRAA